MAQRSAGFLLSGPINSATGDLVKSVFEKESRLEEAVLLNLVGYGNGNYPAFGDSRMAANLT